MSSRTEIVESTDMIELADGQLVPRTPENIRRATEMREKRMTEEIVRGMRDEITEIDGRENPVKLEELFSPGAEKEVFDRAEADLAKQMAEAQRKLDGRSS